MRIKEGKDAGIDLTFLGRILFVTAVSLTSIGQGGLTASMAGTDIGPPSEYEVLIGPNGVIMPPGRILLIRKEASYCAVKFTDMWSGKANDDRYARYESYSSWDESKGLTPGNIKIEKGQLHSPHPRWSLFGHPVAFGEKSDIRCSSLKLWWSGRGTVYFFERGKPQQDYGVELAPTPWTDISQLDLSNPNIKWYRYDGTRKDVKIRIDILWGGGERAK